MFSGWIEKPKQLERYSRKTIILSETAGEFTEPGKSERSFQDGRRIIIKTRKPIMYMISTSLDRVRLITDLKLHLRDRIAFERIEGRLLGLKALLPEHTYLLKVS